MLDEQNFQLWWKQVGQRQLRQILLWRWDPIGVSSSFPNAEDEYDGYLPELVGLLRHGGGADDVARYLAAVRSESIVLESGHPAEEEAVAALISYWFPESIARWQQYGPLP